MAVFSRAPEGNTAYGYLRQLYEIYFPLVKKRMEFVIPAGDVDDCVQNCFIRLSRNIHHLQGLNSTQTTCYVLRTIQSVIVDYQRKHHLLFRNLDDELALEPDGVFCSSVEKALEDKEAREAFIAGFHTLSEIDQFILRSLYHNRLTRKELAETLGIKPASIRTYISRAKKHALQLMRGEDHGG